MNVKVEKFDNDNVVSAILDFEIGSETETFRAEAICVQERIDLFICVNLSNSETR